MCKRLVVLAVVGVACLAACDQARAQGGLDFGIVANNLRFEQAFWPWAWQGAVAAARMMPNDQPLPFGPMTISNSVRQGNHAFDGYMHQQAINSQRTHGALDRWSNAHRGYADFQSPYGGPMYQLPHDHRVYHIDPYGRAIPGPAPYGYGQNVYYWPW